MDPNEIRIWTVLLLAMAWFCYLFWQKRRNVRLARGNANVCIRNKAGRWRWELMPIDDDGLIQLEPRKGKRAGKTFAIDSESAPDMDFPINKMSFVQTTIPTVFFYEENWDPLSNISGRPVLPPALLDIIRHEAWSAHGIRYAHEIEEKEQQKAKKEQKTGVKWWVWVIIFAIVAALALAYQQFAGNLPGAGGVPGAGG